MDLPLDLFRTTGPPRKVLQASVARELTEADLPFLQELRDYEMPLLKRLSERHHALARSLANGASQVEAALICGYQVPRVSMLQDDPAFKELLAFYRNDINAQYRGLHEQLAGLSLDAVGELRERLEAEPEKMSTGQLMELTKLGADRTGHGPQSSTTNVNVNVDMASKLKAARLRNEQRKASDTVIDQ